MKNKQQMNHLNNDQRIRKAHKNVQNLGTTASTILALELQQVINERIAEVKKVIEHNDNLKALNTSPLSNDFKSCNAFVDMGLASNESTLKVLNTYVSSFIIG